MRFLESLFRRPSPPDHSTPKPEKPDDLSDDLSTETTALIRTADINRRRDVSFDDLEGEKGSYAVLNRILDFCNENNFDSEEQARLAILGFASHLSDGKSRPFDWKNHPLLERYIQQPETIPLTLKPGAETTRSHFPAGLSAEEAYRLQQKAFKKANTYNAEGAKNQEAQAEKEKAAMDLAEARLSPPAFLFWNELRAIHTTERLKKAPNSYDALEEPNDNKQQQPTLEVERQINKVAIPKILLYIEHLKPAPTTELLNLIKDETNLNNAPFEPVRDTDLAADKKRQKNLQLARDRAIVDALNTYFSRHEIENRPLEVVGTFETGRLGEIESIARQSISDAEKIPTIIANQLRGMQSLTMEDLEKDLSRAQDIVKDQKNNKPLRGLFRLIITGLEQYKKEKQELNAIAANRTVATEQPPAPATIEEQPQVTIGIPYEIPPKEKASIDGKVASPKSKITPAEEAAIKNALAARAKREKEKEKTALMSRRQLPARGESTVPDTNSSVPTAKLDTKTKKETAPLSDNELRVALFELAKKLKANGANPKDIHQTLLLRLKIERPLDVSDELFNYVRERTNLGLADSDPVAAALAEHITKELKYDLSEDETSDESIPLGDDDIMEIEDAPSVIEKINTQPETVPTKKPVSSQSPSGVVDIDWFNQNEKSLGGLAPLAKNIAVRTSGNNLLEERERADRAEDKEKTIREKTARDAETESLLKKVQTVVKQFNDLSPAEFIDWMVNKSNWRIKAEDIEKDQNLAELFTEELKTTKFGDIKLDLESFKRALPNKKDYKDVEEAESMKAYKEKVIANREAEAKKKAEPTMRQRKAAQEMKQEREARKAEKIKKAEWDAFTQHYKLFLFMETGRLKDQVKNMLQQFNKLSPDEFINWMTNESGWVLTEQDVETNPVVQSILTEELKTTKFGDIKLDLESFKRSLPNEDEYKNKTAATSYYPTKLFQNWMLYEAPIKITQEAFNYDLDTRKKLFEIFGSKATNLKDALPYAAMYQKAENGDLLSTEDHMFAEGISGLSEEERLAHILPKYDSMSEELKGYLRLKNMDIITVNDGLKTNFHLGQRVQYRNTDKTKEAMQIAGRFTSKHEDGLIIKNSITGKTIRVPSAAVGIRIILPQSSL